jgi:DNA-binding MarR family transcriptional regulator
LAKILDVPASTLSNELKRLIELDYLEFFVAPNVLQDGRYRHYCLTPKGISFFKILKSALELSLNRIRQKQHIS